jgi:hypothetical protein
MPLVPVFCIEKKAFLVLLILALIKSASILLFSVNNVPRWTSPLALLIDSSPSLSCCEGVRSGPNISITLLSELKVHRPFLL